MVIGRDELVEVQTAIWGVTKKFDAFLKEITKNNEAYSTMIYSTDASSTETF